MPVMFCLLFICLLKIVFFPLYTKYVIIPGVSYSTWDSASVTLFANKHDYAITKEWGEEATTFRLQK